MYFIIRSASTLILVPYSVVYGVDWDLIPETLPHVVIISNSLFIEDPTLASTTLYDTLQDYRLCISITTDILAELIVYDDNNLIGADNDFPTHSRPNLLEWLSNHPT